MADFDLTLDSQTADTSSAPVEAFFANVPLGMLMLDEQLRVQRAISPSAASTPVAWAVIFSR
jgi:hypothetical protein